jgi:hypothetical protein
VSQIANVKTLFRSLKDHGDHLTTDTLTRVKKKAKAMGWAIAPDGRCYVPERNRK